MRDEDFFLTIKDYQSFCYYKEREREREKEIFCRSDIFMIKYFGKTRSLIDMDGQRKSQRIFWSLVTIIVDPRD